MALETWQRDQALRAVNEMYAEVEKLRAENERLRTPFGALQKTTPLKSGSWSRSLVDSESGWARVEREYAEDVGTAKENDKINAANQALVSNLRKVIESAGFPETRSEWKRNKLVRVPNEWSKCIHVASENGSSAVESRMKEYREHRRTFLEEQRKEQSEREREIAAVEAKRRSDIVFVDLCKELELDPLESSADDIERAIRGKCKYLNLAVAMMDVRNDWNDGCGDVETELGGFRIESSVDEDIHGNISRVCDNFEDGRQFRDCRWNYDRLMREQVAEDARSLWEKFLKIRERGG